MGIEDLRIKTLHKPSTRPLRDLWGVLYYVHTTQGGMTTTHKLIFVASFFWMMNWGVRVTSVLLDKL